MTLAADASRAWQETWHWGRHSHSGWESRAWWLDSMILRVFSNLNDCMILWPCRLRQWNLSHSLLYGASARVRIISPIWGKSMWQQILHDGVLHMEDHISKRSIYNREAAISFWSCVGHTPTCTDLCQFHSLFVVILLLTCFFQNCGFYTSNDFFKNSVYH